MTNPRRRRCPTRPTSQRPFTCAAAAAAVAVRCVRADEGRPSRILRRWGPGVRIAFDSRAATDPRGIGRYVRCLLAALETTAGEDDEILGAPRPRRARVYHSPWVPGAIVHPKIPQVVTLHDLSPLKRRAT